MSGDPNFQGKAPPLHTQYEVGLRHRRSTGSEEEKYFLVPPMNHLIVIQSLVVNVARLQFFRDVMLYRRDGTYRRFEEAV